MDFKNKITGFLKISKIVFCLKQIFENLIIHKTLRGVTGGPTKDLGPVGSAVLICIDTNSQTSVYIEICNLLIKNIMVLIINIFFTYYTNILFREIILLKNS